MTILEAVPGLEVCVLVDNEPLREYHDDDVEPAGQGAIKSVPKYVEAVSDKEFVVRVGINAPFTPDSPTLTLQLTIDGKLVRCKAITTESMSQFTRDNRVRSKLTTDFDGVFYSISGNSTNQLLRKFEFLKIDVAGDSIFSDIQEHSKQMKQAGEIVVRVFRSRHSTKKNNTRPCGDRLEMAKAEVHEKALKGEAKSHIVSVGTATKTVPRVYTYHTLIDGPDHPIALFKFKYRSQDALKSLLVIPRTPSPEPEPASNSETLSLDAASMPAVDLNDPQTMRDFQEFLRAHNRGNNSGNPGPKKEEADHKTQIKTETKVNREPTVHSGSQTIIDLLDEAAPKTETKVKKKLAAPKESITIIDLADEAPVIERRRANRAVDLNLQAASTMKREGSPIESGSPKMQRIEG